MAWGYLLIAGACEVAATTAFRFTDGFTKLGPTLAFAGSAVASLLLLQMSLAGIPLGTAYAVWTGIGAAGTAVLGTMYFNEPATTMRLFFLILLIGSILGLKLASSN
ncbi:MAG: multidrug efflux SMR transporter [Hyphomicrobiaceae bacterium]|nr:multidrug efflux SMR transporter [Hyphomicrobiaceae bacterium]